MRTLAGQDGATTGGRGPTHQQDPVLVRLWRLGDPLADERLVEGDLGQVPLADSRRQVWSPQLREEGERVGVGGAARVLVRLGPRAVLVKEVAEGRRVLRPAEGVKGDDLRRE